MADGLRQGIRQYRNRAWRASGADGTRNPFRRAAPQPIGSANCLSGQCANLTQTRCLPTQSFSRARSLSTSTIATMPWKFEAGHGSPSASQNACRAPPRMPACKGVQHHRGEAGNNYNVVSQPSVQRQGNGGTSECSASASRRLFSRRSLTRRDLWSAGGCRRRRAFPEESSVPFAGAGPARR